MTTSQVFARLSILVTVCFLSAPSARAASFGCESVGGSVIFKDTLYGALTGAVISGLVLLAQSDSGGSDSGNVLAVGTATGGALGLGLGIAEVSFRECPPHRYGEEKEKEKGFHSSIVAMPTREGKFGSGMKVSWNF